MEPPKISYTDPVSRSFSSVGRILFKPFDIGKWFVLGFSAWLATLLSGGSSFQGSFSTGPDGDGGQELQSAMAWVQEHLALIIIVVGIFLLIMFIICLLMLWVSSRGKFMFLDNLVHDRALVKAPWTEFKVLGNSLFWWRLVFGLIVTLSTLAYLGGVGLVIYSTYQSSDAMGPIVLMIVAAVLLLLTGLLVVGYITIMLEDFVIPIMYRERIRSRAAWGRFLSLHRAHFWKFVLYFLWSGLLRFAAGMVLATIGFMTCCCGMFLMLIPYIGAVLVLPVTAFFRLLGPEFLRQFGPDYDVFPQRPALPETPADA